MRFLSKRKTMSLLLTVVIIVLSHYFPSSSAPASSSVSPVPTAVLPAQGQEDTVVKVVDGDTIQVLHEGKKETVRLIGINTPETVDPRKPVECFGKEASEKMKALVAGKSITLVNDPTQADKDKYGRLLRYVFLQDNTFVNKAMIAEGYAYEYTYETPYQYQTAFKTAQQEAQNAEKGLWNPATCASKK